MKRKIIFATVEAGGGHVATAKAMSQSLDFFYPGKYETVVLDFMKEVGCTNFDIFHKRLWRFALRYPLFARFGQLLIDRCPSLNIFFQRVILSSSSRKFYEYLSDHPVDLIVCNHPFLTTGFALAKRRFDMKLPILTFATEPHMISALWADPWADFIFTPNVETTKRLISMGVPHSKLKTIGYPVQQSFLIKKNKADVRSHLKLKNRFTCVFFLGGEGVTPMSKSLIVSLARLEKDVQLVIICGRNNSLFRDNLLQ